MSGGPNKPKDVATTQIYTHVMQKRGLGIKSPSDKLTG